MEINFKDAQVYIGTNHKGDICLRCARSIDENGDRVEPRTQIPTIVSMDNVQALKLAMCILNKLDVVDTRGTK